MAFMGVIQEIICPEVGDIANMVISLYSQGVSFDVNQKPFIDDEEAVHLFVHARDGQISAALDDFNWHKRRESNFNKQAHRATFN